jgi:hypothetical protein
MRITHWFIQRVVSVRHGTRVCAGYKECQKFAGADKLFKTKSCLGQGDHLWHTISACTQKLYRVLFYATSDERHRPSLRVETRADSCAPLLSIKAYIKKKELELTNLESWKVFNPLNGVFSSFSQTVSQIHFFWGCSKCQINKLGKRSNHTKFNNVGGWPLRLGKEGDLVAKIVSASTNSGGGGDFWAINKRQFPKEKKRKYKSKAPN